MTDTSDLEKLAQQLIKEGPHKYQTTPRRVRGLLDGHYVFDTIKAYHVWEHPYYPQLYIPLDAFASPGPTKHAPIDGTHSGAYLGSLTAGSKSTPRILLFTAGPLKDLVRVDFPALDHWFEEDVPIYQHPKDPYKRVDILPSSRSVRVAIDGVTLAETSQPLVLLETLLRTRYYLPPTDVKREVLRESDTETYCPYKGRAEYYHVVVGGKEYRDVVWYYRYPTAESALVAGHLCFYNEKVDVWVDGVKEER